MAEILFTTRLKTVIIITGKPLLSIVKPVQTSYSIAWFWISMSVLDSSTGLTSRLAGCILVMANLYFSGTKCDERKEALLLLTCPSDLESGLNFRKQVLVA